MKNVLKQIIKTRCEVIVSKEEMTRVLEILHRHNLNTGLSIGTLEWREGSKWYVAFRANAKQFDSIKAKLKKEDFKEILIITNASYYGKVERLI